MKYKLFNNLKNTLFLSSIIGLIAFFILTFMARPRMIIIPSTLSIVIFIILSLLIISLISLNLIKVFKNKATISKIAENILLILGLLPLYLVLTGFDSLVNNVYKVFPLISILTIVSLVYYLIMTPIYLIYLLKNKEEDENRDFIKSTIDGLKREEDPLWKYVVYLFVLATAFFAYALYSNDFTIPFGGDYTQQQIPFYTNGYDDYWHFFKTGEFPLWDSNTFLGANNIGSNSFYYSLNPFFFPILIFPRSLIPQGLAILMIVKFVLAALSMRLYLKHFNLKESTLRLFAVIYAFAGWNVYYLWFNHMMEVAVVFPLIFLGIEKVFKEKSPFVLIIGLGLMGVTNYFYLVSACFMGVMYVFVRYIQLFKKIGKPIEHVKLLGIGVFAFAVGILAGSISLLPGIAESLNSDRVSNASYLDFIRNAAKSGDFKKMWEYITSWTVRNANDIHKKYYPLITYFFPVLSDRSSALLNTSSYDNTISSLYVYSPTIMLLIPSLFVSIKEKRFDIIAIFLFVLFMVFTPFFYNALHAFTVEYGRWQIFVVIILIVYVAIMFEKRDKFQKWYFDVSFVSVLIMMLITHTFAYNYQGKSGFGQMEQREYVVFYQYVVVAVSYLVLRQAYASSNAAKPLQMIVSIEAVVMGVMTILGHGVISYQNSVNGGLNNINNDQVVIRKIQALDGSYYRIANTGAQRGHENVPMRENYNGISAFHSLYNYELSPFLSWSHVTYSRNGWSMGVSEKRLALERFLGVKYYVYKDSDLYIPYTDGSRVTAMYHNVPLTHIYDEDLSTEKRYVYKDESIFDFAFTTNNLTTYQYTMQNEGQEEITLYDSFDNTNAVNNLKQEEMYLNSAILNLEDYNSILADYPDFNTIDRSTYKEEFKTLSVGGIGSSKLVKTYQDCTRNYPYQNPTDEKVAQACSVVPNLSKFEGRDVVEYVKYDGSMILEDGGHIVVPYTLGQRMRIFLYDKDDNLITFDHHFSGSGSYYWKTLRGLHSPVGVKKVVVASMGENNNNSGNTLYVYDKEAINNVISHTKTNSISNVVNKTNSFEFSYSSPNREFVVTTIPYDKGWKARSITADGNGRGIDLYVTTGGFIGFVAEEGARDYEIYFRPKFFTTGAIVSVGGFYIGLAGLLYPVIKKARKKKENNFAVN